MFHQDYTVCNIQQAIGSDTSSFATIITSNMDSGFYRSLIGVSLNTLWYTASEEFYSLRKMTTLACLEDRE